MGLLERGSKWLHEQRHERLSVTVTYRRAGQASGVSLLATIGNTSAENLVETELVTSGGVRDFIFRSEDFVAVGVFDAPRPRDQIIEADGTTWEVAEIGSEPCWRWSDHYRYAVRVHCLRV